MICIFFEVYRHIYLMGITNGIFYLCNRCISTLLPADRWTDLFVTIIALIAELINLFMTQTLTKSVEKQAKKQIC